MWVVILSVVCSLAAYFAGLYVSIISYGIYDIGAAFAAITMGAFIMYQLRGKKKKQQYRQQDIQCRERRTYKKKVLSIIFALAMIFSLMPTSLAVDLTGNDTMKTVEEAGYSFRISERIDEYGRITRSIKSEDYESRQTHSEFTENMEKTKAMLAAVGMQKENIDRLDDETLQSFAVSREITVMTSYSKVDSSGNVTYLPEEQAVAESAELNSAQDAIKYKYAVEGAATLSTTEKKYFQDSYMRVDLTVSYQGNAQYLYAVDSEWLTMPTFRGTDSLGACAMNNTVSPDTQYGYYIYDITYINAGVKKYDEKAVYINSNYGNAVNGNWYGSACYFNLPNDTFGLSSSTLYSNFRVHFQYRSHYTSPNTGGWFNAVGNYTHARIAVSPSISVGIDTKAGTLSVAIGLELHGLKDIRGAEVEMHHIPG